jgi:hypothetical protein
VARGDGGTTATLGGGLASTVVTTSMVDVRFRDCWGDASTSIEEVVGGRWRVATRWCGEAGDGQGRRAELPGRDGRRKEVARSEAGSRGSQS